VAVVVQKRKRRRAVAHHDEQQKRLGAVGFVFRIDVRRLVFYIEKIYAERSANAGRICIGKRIHGDVFDEQKKSRKLVLVDIDGLGFDATIFHERLRIYDGTVFRVSVDRCRRTIGMAEKIQTITSLSLAMEKLYFVPYKNSRIAYRVYGKGEMPVFCVHGFSLSGEAYAGLGKYCPDDKSLFALDFPLHGATEWNESVLGTDDLLAIFGLMYEQELQKPLTDFELVGHSMGGRICLYMYQCFAARVRKLTLFAPDGLSYSFGHRLLFRTSIGPKLFKWMSHSTKLIMLLTRFARKIHLVNRSVFNLVKSSYEDADTAHLVYERLMVTRAFYSEMSVIKEKIRQYKTPVYIFFGQYDTLVPSSLGSNIQKGAEPFVHIEVLPCGHLMLKAIGNGESAVDRVMAMM